MKTKEQIMDDYAVSKGYITIIDIINECIIEHDHERILKLINDISVESQKECLKLASESEFTFSKRESLDSDWTVYVKKESITNENNIIK